MLLNGFDEDWVYLLALVVDVDVEVGDQTAEVGSKVFGGFDVVEVGDEYF